MRFLYYRIFLQFYITVSIKADDTDGDIADDLEEIVFLIPAKVTRKRDTHLQW